MSEFDALVDRVERSPAPAVEVPLLFDPEAAAKHRELEAELHQAVNSPGSGIGDRGPAQIAQEIAELYESKATTVFRFVPVSPQAWSDLQAKHPPKPGEGGHVDPAGFWPQAMAVCCETPEGATPESFARLRDSGKVTNGQWNRLINGCRQANEGDNDINPSSTASAVLRKFGQSSTTADLEGSPAQSSLDE